MNGIYMKIDSLCQTLNSHPTPFLTITATETDEQEESYENTFSQFNDQGDENLLSAIPNIPVCDRRVIVFSSRVHPGETNASWIMHGLLDYLTSQTREAQLLRMNYVFKIIPMLNVEGVIHGR